MEETDQLSKALVIDSNPDDRGLLEEILHEYGYQVKGVEEIHEAAPLIKVEDFSLIISEFEFPTSDKIEILDLTRHLGSKARVVLIAPHMRVETYIKALARGAFDCIDKSLEKSALREIIGAIGNSMPVRKGLRISV